MASYGRDGLNRFHLPRSDAILLRIFEGEPELLRPQRLKERNPPPVQRPPTLHPLREGRGEAVLFDLRQLQSARRLFRLTFRN
jgi:hypothetical protein